MPRNEEEAGHIAALVGIWLSSMRFAHEHLDEFYAFNQAHLGRDMDMSLDEMHEDIDHAIVATQGLGGIAMDELVDAKAAGIELDLSALFGEGDNAPE